MPRPGAFKKNRLKISPAQIDRLLRPARVQHPKQGPSATPPGTLLRQQMPTRRRPPAPRGIVFSVALTA